MSYYNNTGFVESSMAIYMYMYTTSGCAVLGTNTDFIVSIYTPI